MLIEDDAHSRAVHLGLSRSLQARLRGLLRSLTAGTSRWTISFYHKAGRQRGNRRPPVAPDKLEAPSASDEAGATPNFTDQGPPKGERAMIETPVLILIVLMAIGAIVWWRATAH